MTDDKTGEDVRLPDEWPPFTEEQMDGLRLIFAPGTAKEPVRPKEPQQ